MNIKEIKELIKLIDESSLAEFKMKTEEVEISIRTEKYRKEKSTTIIPSQQPVVPMQSAPVNQPPAAAPSAPSAEPSKEEKVEKPAAGGEEENGDYLEVRSPIVGTFYRSSSPDKPPYVKVGDVIEKGAVVCIVEAMKLFNEIESEVAGKIVKVMVEDASPVEYDQVLFLVDPTG